MKQKKMLALLLSLAMIVTTVLGNGTFVSASATKATTGISYYVDSVNGNDDNDGTSETKAWKSLEKVNATTFKPGDKLRFKRGCSWSGLLSPKGSGEKKETLLQLTHMVTLKTADLLSMVIAGVETKVMI